MLINKNFQDNDISDNGESEPSSDEAENLDDEEEEDERPAKRQKRTGVHNFIIDEAGDAFLQLYV